MAEKNFEAELNLLDFKVGEIIALVIPGEKLQTASNLITRYTKDFHDQIIKDDYTKEAIEKAFNPFINNTMSIVETLGVSSKQFKSVRRLVLNEMYGAKAKLLEQLE